MNRVRHGTELQELIKKYNRRGMSIFEFEDLVRDLMYRIIEEDQDKQRELAKKLL